MNKINYKYRFGKYQQFISDKMRQRPGLSKMVSKIFGFTNIATYGRQLTFRKTLDHIDMQKITTILDLGCGEGEFSFMLAGTHKKANIDAVDIDSHAVGKIQEVIKRFNIRNIKAINGTIEGLKDDHYDLIFSVDLFQHIPEENMPYGQCYDKLKKRGYLITKMPNKKHRRILPEAWFREFDTTVKGDNKDPENRYIPHYGQIFDLDDLVNKYEQNNFKVLAAFYSDGLFSRAGWELYYIMKKGGSAMHLLSLIPSKLLMKMDKFFTHKKRGNYIQVVGQNIVN